jgi:hypothetical protein
MYVIRCYLLQYFAHPGERESGKEKTAFLPKQKPSQTSAELVDVSPQQHRASQRRSLAKPQPAASSQAAMAGHTDCTRTVLYSRTQPTAASSQPCMRQPLACHPSGLMQLLVAASQVLTSTQPAAAGRPPIMPHATCRQAGRSSPRPAKA